MSQDYRDLIVWQKSIDQCLCIYRLTRTFPKEEQYGLTSQLRRAAVSVASNIAEGRGRLNGPEFRQFLGLAQGSLYELQTQLIVARGLGIGEVEALAKAQSLSDEVSNLLGSFIRTLNDATAGKKLVARS
jgi:four helix bundle protein